MRFVPITRPGERCAMHIKAERQQWSAPDGDH
jgi:hypothetical protein